MTMRTIVLVAVLLSAGLTGVTLHAQEPVGGVKDPVAFFTQVMKVKRLDKCDRLTTEVVAVIAEDDYVTVMMPRKYPDPRKPGAEYYTTWFDTWRFVNGKADEHWDNALIAAPAAPAAPA